MSTVSLCLDQSCLDDRLCCDTSMVVSGSEEHGVSLHTLPKHELLLGRYLLHLPSDHGILKRYRQSVTTM